MSNNVLSDRNPNAALSGTTNTANVDKKPQTMEYHRQALNKVLSERPQQYHSPSDQITSPATAKIQALKSKHASRAKPRSLFAKASAKRLAGEGAAKDDNRF